MEKANIVNVVEEMTDNQQISGIYYDLSEFKKTDGDLRSYSKQKINQYKNKLDEIKNEVDIILTSSDLLTSKDYKAISFLLEEISQIEISFVVHGVKANTKLGVKKIIDKLNKNELASIDELISVGLDKFKEFDRLVADSKNSQNYRGYVLESYNEKIKNLRAEMIKQLSFIIKTNKDLSLTKDFTLFMKDISLSKNPSTFLESYEQLIRKYFPLIASPLLGEELKEEKAKLINVLKSKIAKEEYTNIQLREKIESYSGANKDNFNPKESVKNINIENITAIIAVFKKTCPKTDKSLRSYSKMKFFDYKEEIQRISKEITGIVNDNKFNDVEYKIISEKFEELSEIEMSLIVHGARMKEKYKIMDKLKSLQDIKNLENGINEEIIVDGLNKFQKFDQLMIDSENSQARRAYVLDVFEKESKDLKSEIIKILSTIVLHSNNSELVKDFTLLISRINGDEKQSTYLNSYKELIRKHFPQMRKSVLSEKEPEKSQDLIIKNLGLKLSEIRKSNDLLRAKMRDTTNKGQNEKNLNQEISENKLVA